MKKVTVYSNWCYMDAIDDLPLKSGDKIKVRWADGTETIDFVKVESRTDHYSGHGGGDDITTAKAYVTIEFRGSTCFVRLVDAGVEAELIEAAPTPKGSGLINRK
jgi:hypothetical protein